MAGNIVELTESNFESEVLESSVPVVVDFWAEWCGPCRALAPVIADLAKSVEGRAKVAKLDIDSAQGLAVKYGVNAIPTVLIFKGGEPEKRFVGFTELDELQAAVDEVIS